jgi:hypothetical protein
MGPARAGGGTVTRAAEDSGLPTVLAALAARPRIAALLGATCNAFSGLI